MAGRFVGLAKWELCRGDNRMSKRSRGAGTFSRHNRVGASRSGSIGPATTRLRHDVTTLLNQGLALYQRGEFDQAKRLYEQVLIKQPRHFDALHLQGVIARMTLPRFHVHQIVVNFLMNGERDEQEGAGPEPAIHG